MRWPPKWRPQRDLLKLPKLLPYKQKKIVLICLELGVKLLIRGLPLDLDMAGLIGLSSLAGFKQYNRTPRAGSIIYIYIIAYTIP